MAGTFSVVHRGHKTLLEKAFKIGDKIVVGLTSDEMVRKEGKNLMYTFEERKNRLKEYLNALKEKYGKEYTIVKIDDPYGIAVEDKELDAIVVSEETKFRAEEINKIRKEKGLKPLKVFVVKLVLAENGRKISSTRIIRGEIDHEGKLLKNKKSKDKLK